MDIINSIMNWLGAVVGLGTLARAIFGMLRAQSTISSLETGAARRVLRTPYLVIATVLFLLVSYMLWKPLPIMPGRLAGFLLSLIGFLILLSGCGLYLWGMYALGASFNASTGFGVRLNVGHRLVESGPFGCIRHPMYLGVIVAGWGGLLLYRTWAMLAFAVMMFGLVYRAHAEEHALRLAFGDEWEAYRRSVPGWLPRLTRKRGNQ